MHIMDRNIERELLEDFGTITFSSQEPEHKSLGFVQQEDERDWKVEDILAARPKMERLQLKSKGHSMWSNPIQLDQGVEGACVGFAWTGWANARPKVHEFGNDHGFAVYHEAKKLDPWEGEDYEGTSVRAGAQAMQHRGHLNAYAFTNSVETLAQWVLNEGPVPIGVNWYTGQDRVDSEGYIYPTGNFRGGHSVVIDGVDWGRLAVPNRFRIRNSWNSSWGFNGRCYIKAEDLDRLFTAEGGHACMALEVA